MKVVCTTCCYRGVGRGELDETIRGASAAGYRYIDVHEMSAVPRAAEAAEEYGRQVRRSCLNQGLEPVGTYSSGFGGRDRSHLEQRVGALTAEIAFCQGLGGDRVVGTGAHRRGDGSVANVIECLRRVEPVLAGTAIKIGIEPHYGNVIEQREDYEAIFEKIDNDQIGVCPDIGHFYSACVDVYRFIREFQDRIVHVHLKDHIGTQSVGIGHGEIDIAGFVGALNDVGYDGCLAVELEHRDKENTQRYVVEARAFLERLLDGLPGGGGGAEADVEARR